MATKKQQSEFNKNVIDYITGIGAVEIHNANVYGYELNTKAGILLIALDEPERSEVFSIYCRFEDEKKAFEVLGDDERLNSYTGKWNFHNGIAESALNNLKREISHLLDGKQIN